MGKDSVFGIQICVERKSVILFIYVNELKMRDQIDNCDPVWKFVDKLIDFEYLHLYWISDQYILLLQFDNDIIRVNGDLFDRTLQSHIVSISEKLLIKSE